MAIFIEVTSVREQPLSTQGRKIHVNLDNVFYIEQFEGGSVIYLTNGERLIVREQCANKLYPLPLP